MNFSDHPKIPICRHCQVIGYHPCGVWAFEKANGILSHPNENIVSAKNKLSLLDANYDHKREFFQWMDQNKKRQRLYLVHRLDSPTSGVLLGASSHEVAELIKSEFARRKVIKTYYAIVLVKGNFRNGLWKDNLIEKKLDGKLRVERGMGTLAETSVSMVRFKNGPYGLSLLKLQPKTGRTHQLRIQCALRKIPIVGDRTYGDFSLNRKLSKSSRIDRLYLHAAKIELSIKTNNGIVCFSADSPLPRSFEKLMG